MEHFSKWYREGFLFTATAVFVSSWLYFIAEKGFMTGVVLGWIPSVIFALTAGALWPLIVLVAVLLIALKGYLLFEERPPPAIPEDPPAVATMQHRAISGIAQAAFPTVLAATAQSVQPG